MRPLMRTDLLRKGPLRMAQFNMPSPENMEITQRRLQAHAKKCYIGANGVTDIRGRFMDNYLFLEVIKEKTPGIGGLLFKRKVVKGVGKLARLEYLGPNKWKFLLYDADVSKYVSYPTFQEGTIEECLDAAGKVYLNG